MDVIAARVQKGETQSGSHVSSCYTALPMNTRRSIRDGRAWMINVKVNGEVVPVFNSAPRKEDVLGVGGTVPCILGFGTRWR